VNSIKWFFSKDKVYIDIGSDADEYKLPILMLEEMNDFMSGEFSQMR